MPELCPDTNSSQHVHVVMRLRSDLPAPVAFQARRAMSQQAHWRLSANAELNDIERLTVQIPMELKPALLGAIGGAAALAIVGFNWGGWVTGATAESTAKQRVSAALVTALAPICLDNYRRSKDAGSQIAELKKAKSWEQGDFVEKAGWTKIPGPMAKETGVGKACAELILAEKP